MKMKIRALDEHLINVIAAGEVIERPASVVKELVENSLDAAASSILVEFEGGGARRIAVRDDGEGMDREDLELAVQRHTTSKIRTQEDLKHLRTLGFRGEALASICEVARVTLVSRPAGSEEGTRLIVEGGRVRSRSAAGGAPGTSVEVRELFYNLPARRKFLKAEKTEALHITRCVKRYLFSHPGVHLCLVQRRGQGQGGRTVLVLDSPASSDPREVAVHLYGAALARGLIPVELSGDGLSIRGWVSQPQASRGDRHEQYTFVNGRYVRDASLQYAISRAYQGKLEPDRHPLVCLFLELDPQAVDVNVHPQKEEVRFAEPQRVTREVIRAISEALVSQHAVPHLPWQGRSAPSRPRPQPQPRPRPERPPPLKRQERALDLKAEFRKLQGAETVTAPPGPGPEPETEPYRLLGQLHGTYIVVQTPEGFELIDQHAAHERVLFEQVLEQLGRGSVQSQRLLLPETLTFPPDQAAWIEAHHEQLAQLGIVLERFGPQVFLLREWPQALAETHARQGYRAALERVLSALEQEGEPDSKALSKALAASLACGAAVVKNTALPPEALRSLVERLKASRDPHRCPHGRPIILQYSLTQLERAFGRR